MNIPLNIDWQQILLHLFNFAILCGGLYFLLYKPVKDFMAKRASYYQDMDKSAKDKLNEAEGLKADYQKKLDSADEEIKKLRDAAQADANKSAEQHIEEAKKQAQKLIDLANAEAERTNERVLHDSQEAFRELVADATERLLLNKNDKAIDAFLSSVDAQKKAEEAKAKEEETSSASETEGGEQ